VTKHLGSRLTCACIIESSAILPPNNDQLLVGRQDHLGRYFLRGDLKALFPFGKCGRDYLAVGTASD
ncbi:hypothetical protein OAV21_04830, partial [bacterium]|nr:hypothetical protein [bacterium]